MGWIIICLVFSTFLVPCIYGRSRRTEKSTSKSCTIGSDKKGSKTRQNDEVFGPILVDFQPFSGYFWPFIWPRGGGLSHFARNAPFCQKWHKVPFSPKQPFYLDQGQITRRVPKGWNLVNFSQFLTFLDPLPGLIPHIRLSSLVDPFYGSRVSPWPCLVASGTVASGTLYPPRPPCKRRAPTVGPRMHHGGGIQTPWDLKKRVFLTDFQRKSAKYPLWAKQTGQIPVFC